MLRTVYTGIAKLNLEFSMLKCGLGYVMSQKMSYCCAKMYTRLCHITKNFVTPHQLSLCWMPCKLQLWLAYGFNFKIDYWTSFCNSIIFYHWFNSQKSNTLCKRTRKYRFCELLHVTVLIWSVNVTASSAQKMNETSSSVMFFNPIKLNTLQISCPSELKPLKSLYYIKSHGTVAK